MITLLMRNRRDQRKVVATATNPASGSGKDPNAPEGEPDYKPLEWPVVKKLLGWMRPYKWAYLLALVINLFATMLDMLGPLYIKHLVDSDIPGLPHFLSPYALSIVNTLHAPTAERLSAWVGNHPSYWGIALTILLWAFTTFISIMLSRFNMEFNRRTGEKVVFAIRKAVFNHLQRLSMSFYDRTKFGRILSRGTSDIDALVNPVINGINTVVINAMMMSIAAVMIFVSDWRMALAVLWLGPVLYLMNNIYKRRIGAKWRTVREHFTRVTTNLAENVNGMRVVTAFNRQEENLEHFNDLQEGNTINNLQASTINGIYMPLLNVVGFLGKVIILMFGCYLVIGTSHLTPTERFTVGTLMALYMYWDWFMNPVLNFGNFHNEMMMAMASAERVFALLDQKPEVTDADTAKPLPSVQGHVRFEHVHFGYKADKPVLHDIDFEAHPGQTIALVGHTGCGKSTIMNLICRFYLPQQGRILIDDHDLRDVTGDSLHRQMGIVSQNNYLFSGTVLENICYARPEATEADVIAAAQQLGCHDILMSLKDGYHSQVGERGSAMSLGQRQLICFARAFLANPRILMLDEATSAVDTHTELLIQQALERLVADRTTFIVAHRLSTVRKANLVLVLDHGKIIERGTHESLLALGGKYAELYQQFTREIAT